MDNTCMIIKVSNQGLGHPKDGFRTPAQEWKVYAPGAETATEIFKTKREAVAFAKANGWVLGTV